MTSNLLCKTVETYLEETNLINTKYIDLILVDASMLYMFRPSLYTANNKTLLNTLTYDTDTCANCADVLDSILLSNSIKFIINGHVSGYNYLSNLDDTMFYIFEKQYISNSFNIDHCNSEIIINYFNKLKQCVDGLLLKYVGNYTCIKNVQVMLQLNSLKDFYIADNVVTHFAQNRSDMYISIKLYRDKNYEN